jgi:zinc/manganese transport system permease protein
MPDLGQLFDYQFMVNALEAGGVVAVMAAVVGWFMVVRRQTFAGHTLSVIAFPGAAAAGLAGIPVAWGYYAACATGALALSPAVRRGRSYSSESAMIGTVQAVGLACGFLFVALDHTVLNGLNGILFGTFLGIDSGQVVALAAVAAATVALIALAGRPLLFASLDAEVAAATGVPVRALGLVFLLVLGLAVAATAQITGSLLVFTLLVTPAATAQVLTPRPATGLAIAVGIALAVTWTGLAIAYYSPYPVGFWITSLSFALYVLARVWRALARRGRRQIGIA